MPNSKSSTFVNWKAYAHRRSGKAPASLHRQRLGLGCVWRRSILHDSDLLQLRDLREIILRDSRSRPRRNTSLLSFPALLGANLPTHTCAHREGGAALAPLL